MPSASSLSNEFSSTVGRGRPVRWPPGAQAGGTKRIVSQCIVSLYMFLVLAIYWRTVPTIQYICRHVVKMNGIHWVCAFSFWVLERRGSRVPRSSSASVSVQVLLDADASVLLCIWVRELLFSVDYWSGKASTISSKSLGHISLLAANISHCLIFEAQDCKDNASDCTIVGLPHIIS